MAKLTLFEVRALVQAEKADALAGFTASELVSQRSQALDYYMGDMTADMPTLPDRSRAVSTDVADTVEGLMPALMEIFTAGEETVVFEPVGKEDIQAAKQETDYVNHVFQQKNPGFMVLYSFIKDALLSKNGFVKVWWDKEEREERETYRGLTDEQLGTILEDPAIEIVEHDTYILGEEPDAEADNAPAY